LSIVTLTFAWGMSDCTTATSSPLAFSKVPKRMAKRMPTQTFGYLGSNGRWPDVVLHRAVWPQGLFSVHVN
jgi:hypothetical protein